MNSIIEPRSYRDTIPTKNGRELIEIRVGEEVTNYETKLAEDVVLCVHNTTSALNS